MRNKWYEKVEFIECTSDGSKEQNKIVMFNDTTGDIYLSICPKDHLGGKSVRIERSGGAYTKNPRMVQALGLLYDAIAGNDEEYDSKIINSFTKNEKLLELKKDLNTIKWLGSDKGWELAIEAVLEKINEML